MGEDRSIHGDPADRSLPVNFREGTGRAGWASAHTLPLRGEAVTMNLSPPKIFEGKFVPPDRPLIMSVKLRSNGKTRL
ncbi:MAG: hypothetical protein AMJ54_11500 [Deltaproteobacteria bacterium SG8_13]|nr:MAG: hypothetical protein AMJ54_11500 [Deltaproteobacteria bacterium SG8_13]